MDTSLDYALKYTELALKELKSTLEAVKFDQTVISRVNHALTGVQITRNAQSSGQAALDAQIGALALAKKVMDVQWDSRVSQIDQSQINAAVETIKEALR